MPLQFSCSHCGQIIIVKHLKVGEEAQCKKCKSIDIVPENARDTSDGSIIPDYPQTESPGPVEHKPSTGPGYEASLAQQRPVPPGSKAWNPKALGWMSFFFSFFPAGIIHGYNWERMGYPDKKRTCILITLILLPIYFLLIIYTPDDQLWVRLFGIINAAFGYYYYHSQKKAYSEFLKRGGDKASYGRPVLASIMFVIAFLGVLFLYYYMEDTHWNNRFEKALTHMDNEEFLEAKSIFFDLLDETSGDPELDIPINYNIALAYEYLNEVDSAAFYYKRVLQLDPSDFDAKRKLTKLID